MQLASALVATAVLTPFAWWSWQTPSTTWHWLMLALAGLSGGAGHYFAAQAHRFASVAVLGPFLYQQIIYMTLGAWLVFGQVPDRAVLLGATVVVASGLFLLWREFQVKTTSPAP